MVEAILITILVALSGCVGYLARKLIRENKDKDWAKWYYLAVKAVRAAEKAIPDDVEDEGMKKLDFALDRFCDEYETIMKETVGSDDLPDVSKLIDEAVRKEIKNGKNGTEV